MYKMLRKNLTREIIKTLSRFIAIMVITALGAGFFAGLKAIRPDMTHTADSYYANQRLMDWRLLSTMGFTEDDVKELRSRPGIGNVMAGYGGDYLVEAKAGDEAARIHSLPEDYSEDNPDYLNRLVLSDGRMPQKANECVVDNAAGREIGEEIILSQDNDEQALDMMKVRRFRIVGLADSPSYVFFQRGQTTIGDGRLQLFFYVPQKAFSSDVYTEVFANASESGQVSSFSGEYEALVQRGTEGLEQFGDARADIRYNDMYDEASEELADARKTLADAEKEMDEKLEEIQLTLEDAQKSITVAQSEIAEAERTIAQEKAGLLQVRDEIQAARIQHETKQVVLNEIDAPYQTQKAAYEEKSAVYNKELENYQAQLAPYAGLRNSLSSISSSADSLQALVGQMLGANRPAAQEQFRQQAPAAIATMRSMVDSLSAVGLRTESTQVARFVQNSETALTRGHYQVVVNQLERAVTQTQPGIESKENQIDKGPRDRAFAAMEAERVKFEEVNARWQAAAGEVEQALQQANAKEQQYAAGQQKIMMLEKAMVDGQRKVEEAETQFTESQEEYNVKKEEYENEIEQNRADIEDGEQQLETLEKPTWTVMGRDGNWGYSGFDADTRRLDAIAIIMPVFFFLIASLICLTTMTRMVEEQRTQIGTMKAMGYSRGSIAAKYLLYAGSASLVGAVVGVIIGFIVFPNAMWDIYRMLYRMPSEILNANNTILAVISITVAVLCTVASTFFACRHALRSPASLLMRPKPPKIGKRVWLEHIPAIWRRLPFDWKVTARNMSRNKKRGVVMVMGVAGCTAMLLAGFGLNDAVMDVVDEQYNNISLYDITVNLAEPSSASRNTPLNQLLPDIGQGLYAQRSNIQVQLGNADNAGMTTYVFVAENPNQLPEYVDFHKPKTFEKIDFPNDDGIIITEKLATRLRAKTGDTVQLQLAGGQPADVKVAGVMENYISHNVYMTPQMYTSLFNQQPEYDMMLVRRHEGSQTSIDDIMLKLMATDGVASASDSELIRTQFGERLNNLTTLIWLIIVSASLLAFVVLYNLTNINITERVREIATMKVMGCNQKEVKHYVYRENIILTALGVVVGLLAGIVLHRYIIIGAEIDEVMYRHIILPQSFLFAVLLTVVSAYLVHLFLKPRLTKIDMVTSLKSVE